MAVCHTLFLRARHPVRKFDFYPSRVHSILLLPFPLRSRCWATGLWCKVLRRSKSGERVNAALFFFMWVKHTLLYFALCLSHASWNQNQRPCFLSFPIHPRRKKRNY